MSLYTGLQLPAEQKLAGLIVMSGMPAAIISIIHVNVQCNCFLQEFDYICTGIHLFFICISMYCTWSSACTTYVSLYRLLFVFTGLVMNFVCMQAKS